MCLIPFKHLLIYEIGNNVNKIKPTTSPKWNIEDFCSEYCAHSSHGFVSLFAEIGVTAIIKLCVTKSV